MEEFKVPTIAIAAELRYFDERPLRGTIYLPIAATHREGPMHPEEWINQANLFFPFLVEGEERARILNKRYVVMLTLSATEHVHVWAEPVGVLLPVRVDCGTLSIDGTVYIDMPNHQQRLLDFANRPDTFMIVYAGDRRHIVQKSRITFLSEGD
jgi:hypothetical protein